jgi:6-phosphogluconolactonase (cycloisomerase 2 family)
VFNRAKNGKLKKGKSYPTGSVGSGSLRAATPFPFTESTGAVTLSHDGWRLFVVNHGGNSLTSFRVTTKGLKRVSTVPSGGTGPLSVTVNPSNKLVYVLNEKDPATISAFTVSSKGALKPLANSTRTLAYPAGAPGEILFTHSGKFLVVADRDSGPGEAPDFIEHFKVGKNGRATALTPTPATGQTPFGFTFTPNDALVMTFPDNDRLNQGTVGSYTTSSNGTLTPVDTAATNMTATCWIVITSDKKIAYVSNTLSFSLTAYKVSSGGTLTPLNSSGIAATIGGAPLDLGVARNNKYLYNLNVDPGVINHDPAAQTDIDIFKVGKGGKLTKLSTAGKGMPTTTSGLAVW